MKAFLKRSRILALAFLACAVAASVGAEEAAVKEGEPPVRIVADPLRKALPSLGQRFGAVLSSSRELREQRVTLLGPGGTLERWKGYLRELLSPSEQAGVFWTRAPGAGGSILSESKNRRDLAANLRDTDQAIYRQFVAKQYEWAEKEGWPALGGPPGPVPRRALIDRLGTLMLLDAHGPQGRERLLAGEPLAVPLSRFMGTDREPILREWLRGKSPQDAELPSAELGLHTFTFLRERHPSDPLGGGFTLFHSLARGFVPVHGSMLRMPHRSPGQRYQEGFQIPTSPDSEPGKRYTFILTPDAAAKPGQTVDRNLDQLLQIVAAEIGVPIVADGYLRPDIRLPANLMIRNCTLAAVLKSLTEAWDCDWKYSKDTRAVLIRAKYWWLEDAANVPPEQVEDLRKRLGSRKLPTLEDLLILAELEDPQIRKLVDLSICRTGEGLLDPGLHDGVGTNQVLRFYNRLPPALQAAARSEEGLPLAKADPALVQSRLFRLFITHVGALTPEKRAELVLSVGPMPAAPGKESPGWRVGIRSPNRGGCNWFAYICPLR